MREHDAAGTAALAAVARLQAAYGDAVTRRSWDEVAALFAPDAVVRIDTRTPGRDPIELVGPDAVVAFVDGALRRFRFFLFTIVNATVDLDAGGHSGTGRVYICEKRTDAANTWTEAYGVYHDRYVRLGDDWRIAGRQYHSLARVGTEVEALAFPAGATPPV